MSAKKNVFGLVDAGREVRRPALVGVQLHHQHAMRTPDLVRPGARLHAQDLISLLFRHRARLRPTARPRVRISLSVFTPAGKPAVEIRL